MDRASHTYRPRPYRLLLLYNRRPPPPTQLSSTQALGHTHTHTSPPRAPVAFRRAMARSAAPLLFLLALACRWWCGAVAARPAPNPAAAAFVKSWCAGTEYPAVCDATLSPYAEEVGGSPARLSSAALAVTLGGARDAAAAMKAMAAAGHLAPVAAQAARDCVAMLGDAVDLLRQSVDAMDRLGREEQQGGGQQAAGAGSGSVRFQVDNVQTWASAALTNDDMCMEGFKAEAAATRDAVRGHVAGVAHLTANALGIVSAMAKQIP